MLHQRADRGKESLSCCYCQHNLFGETIGVQTWVGDARAHFSLAAVVRVFASMVQWNLGQHAYVGPAHNDSIRHGERAMQSVWSDWCVLRNAARTGVVAHPRRCMCGPSLEQASQALFISATHSLERERTLPECDHGPLFPKESTALRVSRTLAMVVALSPSPPFLTALSVSNCDLIPHASARFSLKNSALQSRAPAPCRVLSFHTTLRPRITYRH